MKNRMAIVLLVTVTLLSGCSKVVLKSDSDPNVDLSTLETFYVRKFSEDGRGLEQIIAAQLQKLGYEATAGAAMAPPSPVDAIVTYTDRWMWDLTMYMLEINLQFRDPGNEYVFASGNSFRTSLVRKAPEYMIEEVLRDMLGKPPIAEAQGATQGK